MIVSILVRAKIALEKVDDETGKEKEEEEEKKKSRRHVVYALSLALAASTLYRERRHVWTRLSLSWLLLLFLV